VTGEPRVARDSPGIRIPLGHLVALGDRGGSLLVPLVDHAPEDEGQDGRRKSHQPNPEPHRLGVTQTFCGAVRRQQVTVETTHPDLGKEHGKSDHRHERAFTTLRCSSSHVLVQSGVPDGFADRIQNHEGHSGPHPCPEEQEEDRNRGDSRPHENRPEHSETHRHESQYGSQEDNHATVNGIDHSRTSSLPHFPFEVGREEAIQRIRESTNTHEQNQEEQESPKPARPCRLRERPKPVREKGYPLLGPKRIRDSPNVLVGNESDNLAFIGDLDLTYEQRDHEHDCSRDDRREEDRPIAGKMNAAEGTEVETQPLFPPQTLGVVREGSSHECPHVQHRMEQAESVGPALLVGVTLESSRQNGQSEGLAHGHEPEQGEKDKSVARSECEHNSAEEQKSGPNDQTLLHTELVHHHTNNHRVDADEGHEQTVGPARFRVGQPEVAVEETNQNNGRREKRVRLQHLDGQSHPQFTRRIAQRLHAPAERVEHRRHAAESNVFATHCKTLQGLLVEEKTPKFVPGESFPFGRPVTRRCRLSTSTPKKGCPSTNNSVFKDRSILFNQGEKF